MDEKLKTIEAWIALADEKLIVAQKLFDLGYFDDATSRAYYGMFYAAKAALLSINVDTKSHAGVLNQFSQHFIKTGQIEKRYGRMLALVMQARETSDYSPDLSMSPENAKAIIADAHIFIVNIKTFLDIT
jgi:uncharacterized protein (UPF0332 family)